MSFTRANAGHTSAVEALSSVAKISVVYAGVVMPDTAGTGSSRRCASSADTVGLTCWPTEKIPRELRRPRNEEATCLLSKTYLDQYSEKRWPTEVGK